MRVQRWLLPAFLLVPALGSSEVLNFEEDVFPILEAACLDCHDGDTLKGGVGLDSFYYASMPTDAGERLFVAGKPEDSVLYHVVTETDPEKRMPPKGDPLSAEDIATLKRWIEEGAVWPDDGWRPPVHWSFQAPQRPRVPPVEEEIPANRPHNEIDQFIVQRLTENQLSLNPETDPARLLRRVYLDTIGFPPTVEQVNAFLADPSPAAYEAVIDELLASSAFGEKWATQWLDLARYADSEGYQRDAPRNMWPYRDWVIEALNEDMPFDQFSIEQLAGDLLPNATESQKIATAFHRNAPTNLEAGTDPKEDHYKVVADRTATTGTIWLGLTVSCAQCHNHKYDPISAKEYYELFAFFNNGPMETKQQGDAMGMSGLQHIGPTLNATVTDSDEAFEHIATREYRAMIAAAETEVREKATNALEKRKTGREGIAEEVLKALDGEGALSSAQMTKIHRALMPSDSDLKNDLERVTITANRLKAMREKSVRIMSDLEETRATFIAKRGDFLSQGEQVYPATPASLHPFAEELPRNRLGLAKWLVDPANPLVARTFVNRLWMEVFGQGIVTTPEDFGTQGELPSHPELLDWLAVSFVQDDQWSLKKSLRRILLSATYRQSIDHRDDYAEADPRNQLLWRHPGHRITAEMIRDQGLQLSGLLSDRMFGVHSRPYQPAGVWTRTAGASETFYIPSLGEDAYRRGVYTIMRRNNPYPSFVNFDATDRSTCTFKRDVSNTPLQALNLLNDPVFVEFAEAFGKRIAAEGGNSLDEQLVWAFRSALSRQPRESELQLLHSAFSSVLGESNSEERAFFEVATILLNLHETIHRS